MGIDPRTPVLVGAGVAHQHVDDPEVALEAIELMATACERAATPSLLAARTDRPRAARDLALRATPVGCSRLGSAPTRTR